MQTIKNILFRNWLGLLIALIILAFLFRQCDEAKRWEANYNSEAEANKNYKNAIGTLTTQTKTLQLTKSELKANLLQKDDTIAKLVKKFSSIKAIVVTKTVTQFDSIKIPFEVPVPCAFVREDSIAQSWYSFNYKVDSTGLDIKNLKIPNTQTVATGLQRKWFLGKTTLVTEVSNTNPHIKNTDVKSYETFIKPAWYESKLVTFIAGALTLKAVQTLTK